jgi:hypothetical protein
VRVATSTHATIIDVYESLHVKRKTREAVAQQLHAASGEMNKVHAPRRPANISISNYAPQGRRAVADAGR